VLDVPARTRSAIVEEWLARTAETYPAQTAQFLLEEKDPFRNPVGQALKNALPILFDEIVHDMDIDRVTPALEAVMRTRAVQDFTASCAVAFLFLLKGIVRERIEGAAEDLALFDDRIDRMVLLAFDLFMKCREQIYEIKLNEARRGLYLQLRRASRDG
jgi:hypothetical protein